MSESFSFNSSGIEPSRPRDTTPIPDGWYRMWIVASELKPTKRQDGTILELELDVIDGPQKGRKVWTRLNVKNPSAQAQEIALRDLSAICHATGVLKFSAPAQLHRKQMLCKVVTEEQPGYKPKNEIAGYREMTSEEPAGVARSFDEVVDAAPAEDDDLPF